MFKKRREVLLSKREVEDIFSSDHVFENNSYMIQWDVEKNSMGFLTKIILKN